MLYSLDFVSVAMLLAAGQGFFLSAIILQKYGKLYANRFLGALVLCYSLILIHLFFQDVGFYQQYPHILILLIGLPFLVGPLNFLYARSLIYISTRLRRIDWFHFLPYLIFQLLLVPRLFLSSRELTASFPDLDREGLPIMYIIFNWIITVQGVSYAVLTLAMIRRHSLRLKDVYSTVDKLKLDWLKLLTVFALAAWSVFIFESVLYLAGINFSNFFKLSSFLIALYVYALGYVGILKSDRYLNLRGTALMIDVPGTGGRTIKLLPVEAADNSKKYEKSGLSPENAEEYLNRLQTVMDKSKPYRNSELTLPQLAEMISVTPHNLSEILNTRLHQNFFDFINHNRVEEVKKELADPAKKHLKILSIALDAGFNSKSAFNTIFKKTEKMTPSQYRRKYFSQD